MEIWESYILDEVNSGEITMTNKYSKINLWFVIIQAFTVVGLFINKQNNNALEALMIFVIFYIFIYLEKRSTLSVENHIRILVMLTIIANNLIGHFFNAYSLKYFDKVLHIFGTFSFTLFAFSIINKLYNPIYKSKWFMFIVILALGVSFGTIYEIIEFAQDSIFSTNNQAGLKDTNWDLIADITGAFLAAVYLTLYEKNHQILW